MTRLALRVLPWVLVMTGCENWGVDGMARLEERYPERPEDTGPAPDVPTVDLGDVGGGGGTAGTWLLRVVLTGGMKVFADPSDIVQTDLFLVSISDGGGPALLTFCNQVTDVDLAGGMGETELSEETREAIGESPLAVGLDAEGLPAAQEIVWTWGLKDMVEPFTDPLPTEPSDPRVWDQDEDGNPGVTVHVLGP
ncbi:MAG: hypothetical protein FJ098_08025, partial [Deltaproteobacteria bacterium]|nr:hypothetical protein [Deltaproteobacteria bacterium]